MPRKVSSRASRVWSRLGQWYGSRLADNYGPEPPEDWRALIDRTDDERLEAALFATRRASPIHVPTLGQVEAAIPKRQSVSVQSKPERLAMMLLAKNPLCQHQLLSRWNYFGPVREFELMPKQTPPAFVSHADPRGVQVAACPECERPTYRVLLEDETTAVAA